MVAPDITVAADRYTDSHGDVKQVSVGLRMNLPRGAWTMIARCDVSRINDRLILPHIDVQKKFRTMSIDNFPSVEPGTRINTALLMEIIAIREFQLIDPRRIGSLKIQDVWETNTVLELAAQKKLWFQMHVGEWEVPKQVESAMLRNTTFFRMTKGALEATGYRVRDVERVLANHGGNEPTTVAQHIHFFGNHGGWSRTNPDRINDWRDYAESLGLQDNDRLERAFDMILFVEPTKK
jgi:hypothetical protein